eukprot:jgi/Tetstr1/447570/TSEL_034948.t1
MPDNSGDAPSGLAEDRIAALEAGFAGLTELLEALRSDLQRPSGSTPAEPRAPASSAAAASSQHDAPARAEQCFGFYDAVAHAALCEALASIKRAASAAQPPGEEDLRLLEAGVAAYDVSNKHRRDFLAFIRLDESNDADARTKTVAQVVRRSLLKPGFADYGSEAVAQLSDELLRRARGRVHRHGGGKGSRTTALR